MASQTLESMAAINEVTSMPILRPLVAMDEAAGRFSPDGIVISTHPEGRSAWLRQDLVARAREKYDVPVDHVVARAPAGVPPT